MGKIKRAITLLSLFMLPFFAETKKEAQRAPFGSVSFNIKKLDAASDEWGESIDNLTKNLRLKGELPPLVFYEAGIEKYFGGFYVGLKGSKAFPQRLRGSGETKFYIDDVLFATVETSVDQKFSEENLSLNIGHNFPVGSSAISFGVSAGIFRKLGEIKFSFAQYNVVNDTKDLAASCDVSSFYEGTGYQFNANVASDWHIAGPVSANWEFSYYVWGKKSIKRIKYDSNEINVNVSLMDEREIDRQGSIGIGLGLKVKF